MSRKKASQNAKKQGEKKQGQNLKPTLEKGGTHSENVKSQIADGAQAKSTQSDGGQKNAPKPLPSTHKAVPKSESKDKVRSNPFKRFTTYVEEARVELRKVSWPTMPETRKATLVVFAFVAVMSILLGLVDLGLSSLIGLMLA